MPETCQLEALCQRPVGYKRCDLVCARNLSVTSTVRGLSITSTVSLPVSEICQLQALPHLPVSETELQVLCPCLCQKPVTYKHCVIGLLSETCQLKHCVLACMRSVSYKHCVRDPSVTSTVSLPESEIRPLQALCPCLCQRSVSYKHCVLACVRNLSVTSTVSLPVSEIRQLQALCPCLCQKPVRGGQLCGQLPVRLLLLFTVRLPPQLHLQPQCYPV